MSEGFEWLKGHGTRNDFVVLPDPDGSVHGDLDAAVVVALCDRHRGIGADGVLRVIRSESLPEGKELAGDAEWFMDYRNADGSLAQMCGNGVRVFVAYLLEQGLVPVGEPVAVATRGGVRTVHVESDGQLTVEMGRAEPVRQRVMLYASTVNGPRPAFGWYLPNPHAVVFVDDLAEAGPLSEPPLVEPGSIFPDGVNVEYVMPIAAQHIAMRVHERGVGETLSCGTGACAAAVASMRRDQAEPGTPYVVDVPGGRLSVLERADGEVLLTGPAVLGLRGTLSALT